MVVPIGMTAVAKLTTVVWQIFLLVGPSIEDMRRFMNRVVSIVSDFGTERLIVVAQDQLREILKLFGDAAHYAKPAIGALMFPIAMQIGGWKHIADGLIWACLSRQDWFTEWMNVLKASG